MSSDDKTLVILTPGFAADEADSTCIPMQQSFVRTLNENYPGLKIVIFAFDYPYSKRSYSWFGNKVLSFNGQNKGGLRRLLIRRAILMELQKIHAEHTITGVLSFWYGECALTGNLFSVKYGIRHFCWMWGQDVKKTNKYVSLVNLEANQLIAFSDFLRDEFEKNHGIRPGHVITPGIRPSVLSTTTARDIDIIAAGSLIPLKQYDIFARIIGELKKSLPQVRAVLVGDGPEKKKIEKLIEITSLTKNIELTDELPHAEVLQYMQRSKLFLHPSSYEGFGIVCLEALASGCEVISFVKPMNGKIDNWHIVENEEEMTTSALAILRNSKTAYQQVIPFTIEGSVKKMARLFSLSE